MMRIKARDVRAGDVIVIPGALTDDRLHVHSVSECQPDSNTLEFEYTTFGVTDPMPRFIYADADEEVELECTIRTKASYAIQTRNTSDPSTGERWLNHATGLTLPQARDMIRNMRRTWEPKGYEFRVLEATEIIINKVLEE